MASNITVDTLTKGSTTLNTDEIVDTSSNQICKAWVNFNGSGTVAIRDSYNVSSITDNTVGDYTVNFTNSMANNEYSATFGGCKYATSCCADGYGLKDGTTYLTASSIRTINKISQSSVLRDMDTAMVTIFSN